MAQQEYDFLNIGNHQFENIDDFTSHLKEEVELSDFEGKLSIIGSISEFDRKENFVETLSRVFNVRKDLGSLLLATSKSRDVPFYIHLNGMCPIFLTTGTKTEDQPATIDEYFQESREVSRLWVGKRQMEEIRREVIDENPDVLIPYFTAHHSPTADTPVNEESGDEEITRPSFERTIQYYGKDGREAFKELRNQYGVFPTNVQFEKPGAFKFRVTKKGTFTLNKGSLSEPLDLIQQSIDRLREVRGVIKKSGYTTEKNQFSTDREIRKSDPWAIRLPNGLESRDVRNFKENAQSRDWHFKVSRMRPSYRDQPKLRAELVDKQDQGRATLRTSGHQMRIYPREYTTFSHYMRIFSFVNDHIDQQSEPVQL